MFENRVVFQLGSERWTLAGVCTVMGVALLVIGAVLLTVLLVRHGHVQPLDAHDASRVAFNADKLGGELRPIRGPARGAEVRLAFSVGDLRRAYRAGDRWAFWGVPALLMTWSGAFGFLCLSGALWTRSYVLLLGYVVLIPIFLIGAFMPWAALHTELE